LNRLTVLLFAATFVSFAPLSRGTVIDFEAQAASKGGLFTSVVDSPLFIDIATLTGGALLKAVNNLPADQTGVYGTFNTVPFPGYLNPITIAFATPINNFSVFVANGEGVPVIYTVADDLGHSTAQSLVSFGSSGAAVFSLPFPGIHSVTITATPLAGDFTFFIDNVTFTPVPEPSTAWVAGPLLALLLARSGSWARAQVSKLR